MKLVPINASWSLPDRASSLPNGQAPSKALITAAISAAVSISAASERSGGMERLSVRMFRGLLRRSLACGLSTPVLAGKIFPEMRAAHTGALHSYCYVIL